MLAFAVGLTDAMSDVNLEDLVYASHGAVAFNHQLSLLFNLISAVLNLMTSGRPAPARLLVEKPRVICMPPAITASSSPPRAAGSIAAPAGSTSDC
jgi:hypothetical protein